MPYHRRWRCIVDRERRQRRRCRRARLRRVYPGGLRRPSRSHRIPSRISWPVTAPGFLQVQPIRIILRRPVRSSASASERRSINQTRPLNVFAFFCEIFSFAKFPFSLEPKLFVSSRWSAIFFPNLMSALSDSPLVGPCQGAGSLFQFFRQRQYLLSRFRVANLHREVAVLTGLHEKSADDLLSIHWAISI